MAQLSINKTKNEVLKIAGIVILSISCILFLLIPIVPLLHFSVAQKTAIGAGLLIAGEILFYLSLFILGRSFYDKIKNRLKFRKHKDDSKDINQ
jgi:hypothetical protein